MPTCVCCTNRLTPWGPTARGVELHARRDTETVLEVTLSPAAARELAHTLLDHAARSEVLRDELEWAAT